MTRQWKVAVPLLLLASIAVFYLGRSLERGGRARFPSSLAPEPEGVLAFRRLLDALEIPVEVWTRPWDALATEDVKGLLVVTTPLSRNVDAREAKAMRDWLARGRSLLVVDDATVVEETAQLEALLEGAGLAATHPVSDPDLRTLTPSRPKTRTATGTPVPPAGGDLKNITLQAGARLEPLASGIPLALGPRGEILAAEGALQGGRVVRVLGALLANDRIAEGDNLSFGLRLVEDLRAGGTVWFDEFHHGYGGLVPALRGLDRDALAWSALQALFATIAFAVARGVRSGPPRRAPARSLRTSLEFVRSMASLYQRAKAHHHVLEGMVDRFHRETLARWGVTHGHGYEAFSREIAALAGVPQERVEGPLREARESLARFQIEEREMVERAKALARLEEEVLGAGRTRS